MEVPAGLGSAEAEFWLCEEKGARRGGWGVVPCQGCAGSPEFSQATVHKPCKGSPREDGGCGKPVLGSGQRSYSKAEG